MNKPVAWKSTLQSKWFIPNEDMETGKYDKQFWIPLYTHPTNACKHGVDDGACKECYLEATHPVKELTDEEIYRLLADSIWAVGLNTDCLDEQNWADGITVARSILRKEQEKC